jgi:hypothetical protein
MFRREMLQMNNQYNLCLETIIINISGLFYFKEVLIFNVVASLTTLISLILFRVEAWFYKIVMLISMSLFNLLDIYMSFSREVNNINNLIVIEKKSLQLSQFVDRLLPKHVKKPLNFL